MICDSSSTINWKCGTSNILFDDLHMLKNCIKNRVSIFQKNKPFNYETKEFLATTRLKID